MRDPAERRPKILLVDDSRTVLSVLRTYLMGHDFDFLQADGGKEALSLVMRERPAAVISDVDMPEVSGLDLCRAVRASRVLRATKLVLISSKWTPEREAEADDLEVDARFCKPIDSDQLAQLISGWFD
jgi:CheY-like chemotaxis protein